MNNLRTSPVGIDNVIQQVQTDLYLQLSDIWEGDIEGYGRVYKNTTNDNEVIPEWFSTSLQDYEDVYYNDSKSCVFCFLVGDNDTTSDELVYTSKVKCVFMVDLSKIYVGNTNRNDAESQRDVVEALRDSDFNTFEITGIQRTLSSVFQGYNLKKIEFTDMQPLHCFSVNFDLSYYLTDKCN